MDNRPPKTSQIYLSVIALPGWFALGLQFYLIILHRMVSIPETIVRYFTFFTILTNILVALYATFLLLKPGSQCGKYFSKPNVVAAITIYITTVGIVYNMILRSLWNPQGWDRAADELLHLIIPLLFLVYWLIFIPKGTLKLKDTFPWLIYPLIYFIWVLIFGRLTRFYPYPFIDVNKLGYDQAIINSAAISIGFLFLSFLLVALDRLLKKKTKI